MTLLDSALAMGPRTIPHQPPTPKESPAPFPKFSRPARGPRPEHFDPPSPLPQPTMQTPPLISRGHRTGTASNSYPPAFASWRVSLFFGQLGFGITELHDAVASYEYRIAVRLSDFHELRRKAPVLGVRRAVALTAFEVLNAAEECAAVDDDFLLGFGDVDVVRPFGIHFARIGRI